jgi:hypothetical protein
MAELLKKKRQRSKATLTIHWTAGHEGIEGNKLADKEAKEVAKGHTSEAELLPLYLRKLLMINTSAIKAAHNTKLKKEWQDGWKKSKQGIALARIDESTPSGRFLKAISNPKLPREEASSIAQLRLKHFPLNRYLKRIRKVDNARCPAYGADEENIEHFLLSCPSYAYERWNLARHAEKKHKPLTIKTLLGDKEFVLPLAMYIQATGRLKIQGESLPNQNRNTTREGSFSRQHAQ